MKRTFGFLAMCMLSFAFFLFSPLTANADGKSHHWVLWQEKLTGTPYAAVAVGAFKKLKECAKIQKIWLNGKPAFSPGIPLNYVCLPSHVRPFYQEH